MTVVVRGVTFTGDPCRRVTYSGMGVVVTAGERAMAHLFDTDDWLRKKFNQHLYVVQSAYHSGYAPSAGTHDLDRVFDVYVITKTGRKSWLKGRKRLRMRGWADWWRHTGSWWAVSTWHHHMVSLGGDCPVGIFVPGQIADYYNHDSGLVGHLADPGWYPEDINATIFDFAAWMRKQEEDMGYAQWDKADKDAFWADFEKRGASAVWTQPVNVNPNNTDAAAGKDFRSIVKETFLKVTGK